MIQPSVIYVIVGVVICIVDGDRTVLLRNPRPKNWKYHHYYWHRMVGPMSLPSLNLAAAPTSAW